MDNLFERPRKRQEQELTQTLVDRGNVRIERIVSDGHVTGWYDQEEDEWVCLLEGEATLEIEGPGGGISQKELRAGAHVLLPAHVRHRVARTTQCVWLCVFMQARSARPGKDFYTRSALELAPALLGKLLCRRRDGRVEKLRITETECYLGEADTACHAHKGRTKRTAILYEEGGVAYVYLCYGIHHLLNVVTGPKDFPQAVLIRGVEGFSGPGRLTRALGIDMSLNTESFLHSDALWIEDDGTVLEYETGPRVGIDYASEEDKNRPWRFLARTCREKK